VTTNDCPDQLKLAAFFEGTLATDDHLRVARHIRDCPLCQKLSSDAGWRVPTRPALPLPFFTPDVPVASSVPAGAAGAETIIAPMDRIGSYLIRRLIGRGGMGTVYEAVNKRLGRAVALKMLPRAVALDPEYLTRFDREMRACGKLDHENVVRVLHADDVDEVPFLVMELVDGVDLARALQAVDKLPVSDACEITRRAALGLAHAHDRDIVHRDVKPSNLLITAAGEVKLTDFGLAVFVTPVGRTDERITGLTVLGTHDYMAPEQWADPAAVTGRADVYGLGCVLFQMLVGRPPFGSPEFESPNAKKRAHQHSPPPYAARLRQDVPAPLADLIAQTLAKRPDERPSAAQFATALKVFVGGTPPLARLVERTRLAPGTGFADGQPTALAPIAERTISGGGTADTGPVAATSPTERVGPPRPRPVLPLDPPRTPHLWELILGVTVLTTLLLGALAALLSGKF
jgi:hypothetical protein